MRLRDAAPLALAIALAVTSAGCAERAGGALDELRGTAGAPEPYFMEYREPVAPQHNASYDVPVGGGALALQVNVDLVSPSEGLPAAATLRVDLVGPEGSVLATRLVDARTPAASLGLTQMPPGGYIVRVTGGGLPDLHDEARTGASYVLTVEVVYA